MALEESLSALEKRIDELLATVEDKQDPTSEGDAATPRSCQDQVLDSSKSPPK